MGLRIIAYPAFRDAAGYLLTCATFFQSQIEDTASVECLPLRGGKPPIPVSDYLFLSLDIDDYHESDLAEVSERQRKKIMESVTYKQLIAERNNPKPKLRAADLIDDGFPPNLGIEEAAPGADEGPGADDEMILVDD